MSTPRSRFVNVVAGMAILAGVAGCAESRGPRHAGRSPAQRQKVILPTEIDGKPAGKRRNSFFDRWNEQIVRQDIAVGTVFFGDSITEWWDLAVYFTPADGLIENRGVSGDTASHMLRRLDADVIQLRPRNVLILAGTNDVKQMIVAEKADDEVVREVAASVEALMQATRSAGINTLVGSILPTHSAYALHGKRTRLRARVNERIRAACAAHGCVYVDFAAAMSDANGDLRKDLAPDGVHPNPAGYAVMAAVLEKALRQRGWRL